MIISVRSLALICCLVITSSVFGAEIKINFNDYAQGQSLTNFHSALAGGGKPGEWSVVMDDVPSAFGALSGQAPVFNRHGVLAQTSTDATDERFPMFIYDGETFGDFKLTTQFKIVDGVAEQMAGIVFHFQNESNFYVVRASALGHNIRFYKVFNGVRSAPIGPVMDISTNVWHTLNVQCSGTQISVWLDGSLILPLNDTTFTTGKIGFWTKSDAVSRFGDTTIEYTPLVPAAQVLVDKTLDDMPRILSLRICLPDEKGSTQIIASKDKTEIGKPGNEFESDCSKTGQIYFAREKNSVIVTMPLCDKNGVPIASARVGLKTTILGETQDSAISRVRTIIQQMQKQVTARRDLLQ